MRRHTHTNIHIDTEQTCTVLYVRQGSYLLTHQSDTEHQLFTMPLSSFTFLLILSSRHNRQYLFSVTVTITLQESWSGTETNN